jgi:anti-sigma factor RsiW
MRCYAVEPLLSEYIDNRLSARQTIEVERHLAECNACARSLNELRRTVSLVGDSARLSVSEDFMRNLQSRLEGLQPNPAPRAWLESVRSLFRPRILPVWGAAAAAAAIAVIVLMPQNPEIVGVSRPARKPNISAIAASHQNVAISASDPFADIASANLAAHVTEESGMEPESL